MVLTRPQRETLLARIQQLVAEKYFDPDFDETTWNRIIEEHRRLVVEAENEPSFEKAVAMMLAELPPSPLALLSERTLIAPPNAINANFSMRTVDDQPYWVFKDLLPGGVAARAGVKAGDRRCTQLPAQHRRANRRTEGRLRAGAEGQSRHAV